MRILKFIFKSLLTLLLVGGVAFLVAREVLLFMGVSQIKSSLSVLRSASVSKNYFKKCRERGAFFGNGDETVLQLRFISPHEYLVEILCSQVSINPIIISRESLPLFVSKTDLGSGIIWGENRSGITLEILGRQRSIGVESRLITTLSNKANLGIGPVTSCEGYGYQCCQNESEQGTGDLLTKAIDCPRSCYQTCKRRPVVLSFNTQPFMERESREVNISQGEGVDFSYVIDSGPAGQISVKLDYGDGQFDTFTTDKQLVSHTYQCAQSQCLYKVKLSAADGKHIQAVDLPVMNLTVKVKGR